MRSAMMRGLVTALLLAAGLWPARAQQVKVEPVLLEADAPAATASLHLQNEGTAPVTVQTRVMRWSQENGEEKLTPTTDVVVSPPIETLQPGLSYIARVVRVSKTPIAGEESYRVLVDQLPAKSRRQNRSVSLMIRQSIPAFFRTPELAPPQVSWSFTTEGGSLQLHAVNTGDERLRLASLSLRDDNQTLSFGNGLNGYVLGHGSNVWKLEHIRADFGAGGTLIVSANTNKGRLNATAHRHQRTP